MNTFHAAGLAFEFEFLHDDLRMTNPIISLLRSFVEFIIGIFIIAEGGRVINIFMILFPLFAAWKLANSFGEVIIYIGLGILYWAVHFKE